VDGADDGVLDVPVLVNVISPLFGTGPLLMGGASTAMNDGSPLMILLNWSCVAGGARASCACRVDAKSADAFAVSFTVARNLTDPFGVPPLDEVGKLNIA